MSFQTKKAKVLYDINQVLDSYEDLHQHASHAHSLLIRKHLTSLRSMSIEIEHIVKHSKPTQ
jgi:hypothetical protein